jgi:hypothetical protein
MLAELEYPPELRLREFGRVVGTLQSKIIKDFLRSRRLNSLGLLELNPYREEVP